jgi:hypothetical protein
MIGEMRKNSPGSRENIGRDGLQWLKTNRASGELTAD